MITNRTYVYGTHLPALLDAVLRTNGPVLEIGTGLYSTPFLSHFNNDRLVISVETEPRWAEQAQDWGMIVHDNLDVALGLAELWDVILIDGGSVKDRQTHVELVKKRSKFVVVHDTEDPVYGYDFSGYAYQKWWKSRKPWTTVLSNYEQP